MDPPVDGAIRKCPWVFASDPNPVEAIPLTTTVLQNGTKVLTLSRDPITGAQQDNSGRE